MSKHLRTLAVGAAMVGGLAAAPVLYAQDYLSMRHGSMMGQETMGQGGMMSGGGMMGMSGDISGTGDMMERCNEMMQAMGGAGTTPIGPTISGGRPSPSSRTSHKGKSGKSGRRRRNALSGGRCSRPCIPREAIICRA